MVLASPRAGPSIPDYELLCPIGRGAYGEVWLARNLVGSWVALKIVYRTAFDHDRPFEREFEGIKRFEPISRSDPSQVAILHVGLGNGFFYYVMELADDAAHRNNGALERGRNGASDPQGVDRSTGSSDPSSSPLYRPSSPPVSLIPTSYVPRTLRHELHTRGCLPARECVEIALSLTRALAHLHRNGLVHRDVKPSNVIFVNGQAKLADLGLVASADGTGSFVGTEGYLPPEGAGTPQADLFALGKVLYEMSTGCDRREFPALPSDIATRPDREAIAELNAIVVHACHLDFERRFASAELMQEELDLFRRGYSIKRRRASARFLERFKIVSVATFFLALLVGVLSVSKSAGRIPGGRLSSSMSTFETAGTKSQEAFNAYRTGRFHWWKRTAGGLTNAIAYFEKACRLDTNFARAFAGLTDSLILLDGYASVLPDEIRPAAEAAISRALELAPELAEVQASWGKFLFVQQRDWAGAARAFKRAKELDPSYALAHLWYADYLAATGKCEEAVRECRLALELEPASLILNCALGLQLVYARDYEGAVEQYRRTIALDPYFLEARNQFGWAFFHAGQYHEAIAQWEKAAQLAGADPAGGVARQAAYTQGGMRSYWRKRAEQLKVEFEGRIPPALIMAKYSAVLGEVDDAFSWLEKALVERRDNIKYLSVDPVYDPLRDHPRFATLLKRIGHTTSAGGGREKDSPAGPGSK